MTDKALYNRFMGRGRNAADVFASIFGDKRGTVRKDPLDSKDPYEPVRALLAWTPYIISYVTVQTGNIRNKIAMPDSKDFAALVAGQNDYWPIYDKTITLSSEAALRQLVEKADVGVAQMKENRDFGYRTYLRGACRALVLRSVIPEEDYLALCAPIKELIRLTIEFYEQMAIFDKDETYSAFTENRERLYNNGQIDWVPLLPARNRWGVKG
jgi:hypothetical protein